MHAQKMRNFLSFHLPGLPIGEAASWPASMPWPR
jgi:hypothetical protein